MANFGVCQSINDADLSEIIERDTQFWCQKLGVTPTDLFRGPVHELEKKLVVLRKKELSKKRQKSDHGRDSSSRYEKSWRLPELVRQFQESQQSNGDSFDDSEAEDDYFDDGDDGGDYDAGPCSSNGGSYGGGNCGAQQNSCASCNCPFEMGKDQYINQCMGKPPRKPPIADVVFHAPPNGCVPCWGSDNKQAKDPSCCCSCPPDFPKICPRVKGIEYEETFLKKDEGPADG
ncbi:uncharacterized protein LOC119665906 [Teleopsis dalmanni]|uniref:uncharacterized protein LOC119665906 n=1 Tax=Teleopsis dalmanni TaxID=139649 RepID=UPI0018CD891B|nr:uncharacterized protein LOC119665906 [Teleopsis dalmanni]